MGLPSGPDTLKINTAHCQVLARGLEVVARVCNGGRGRGDVQKVGSCVTRVALRLECESPDQTLVVGTEVGNRGVPRSPILAS